MILDQLLLTKAYVRNYCGIGYMTIGKGPHQQRIPFVPLRATPVSDKSDSDSLEADNSESKGIYTNDSLDYEVGLYVIEAVPKRGVPLQRQISAKPTRVKPVLSHEEIA